MTAVGDVIEQGKLIPDVVIEVDDSAGDEWTRRDAGWICTRVNGRRGEHSSAQGSGWLSRNWGPLTVTAVREPEPDHCGNNVYVHEPHEWLGMSDDGDKVVQRRCSGTGPGREPEPQPVAHPYKGSYSGACAAVFKVRDDFGDERGLNCGKSSGDPVHLHPAAAGERDDVPTFHVDEIFPPEPEPQRRLRECVENWPNAETGAYDPRCCRFPKSCSATVYDTDAVAEEQLEPTPTAEPQQADVPVLLDLVRQYGDEMVHYGETGEQRYAESASLLLDRIAALVPQQPVRAVDHDGQPFWQHGFCGDVYPDSDRESHVRHGHCESGPWRPLLVGGNPAPEQPAAPDFLAAVNKLTIQRDEARRELDDARADGDRLRARIHEAVNEANARGAKTQSELAKLRALMHEARDRHGEEMARNGLKSYHHISGFGQATAAAIIQERDEARAEAERLNAEAERVTNDLIGARDEAERLKAMLVEIAPAPADPLVLSLPEVPRKDVTLVGAKGTRFVPVGAVSWCAEVEGGRCFGLGELLDLAGPLTVEMAPPREPRTWPRLDDIPDDLKAVKGASGKVYRRHSSGFDQFGEGMCSIGVLQRIDGPLTEVFDNEPGGEQR